MSGKSDYLTSRLRTGNSSYLTNRLTNIDPPREEADEERGFFANTLAGAGERGAELVSNLLQFTGNVAQSAGNFIDATEGMPFSSRLALAAGSISNIGGDGISFDWSSDPNIVKRSLDSAAGKVTEAGDFGYEPRFTWENFKGEDGKLSVDDWTNPKKLAGFIVEQGVHSAPDMAAALATLPAYIASRTQEIAEARAENKGLDPANFAASELQAAAIPAVAASVLERLGAKGILDAAGKGPLKGLLAGSAKEAGTEFFQEIGEYAGEVVGTPVGFDSRIALDRGIAGAVAGGGIGAAGGALTGQFGTAPSPIAEAAERGANQARAEGGDSLDQSARAAQEAAQVSTVDTINTSTGQTKIEMQGNQSDVDALRERFGINQGSVEPVILTPEETTIPTDAPLQATQFDPLLTPTPFEPLDALDAANRSINRAVVLNARDQRRALRDGDQASADALEDDSVKLRALQSRIVSARELQALPESERVAGQSEMIENILRDVSEAINQESAARESFSYVNVLEGELLPRIDETLQALRGVGALTPRQIAEGRQIAYQPPTDFEVDPEGQAGRPGERARIEMEREAALEPVERDFNALREAYESGDTEPLVNELDAIAARLSDLQTRRTGTAVTTDDDVLTAIAKAGGIDIQEAISQGLDPADNPGRGRLSLFRREGGMTFDGVAEFLAENGFTQRAGDTFEAGVQDANTALEIVADALNARADGNLTFLNSGKAAEIQEAQMRLDVAEQALFELKQTGQNLSPEDEVLIAQLYEEMYDEVYGRADTGRVARSAEEEIASPRDNVIPGGDRGSEIQPQLEPRAPESGGRELRQSDGPPQGRQSVTPQTGPQGPVFDFSAEKERLTKRLANFKTQDLTDLLKEAGLRTVGNRQDKIDRIITFREAGALLNQYDSYESAEQALVGNNGLSPDTIARYADSLRRSGDRKISPQQTKTNLFSVYNVLNRAGMTQIPQYTPETQARRDEEAATREAESAQREQVRASEDEQIQSWLEENRDQVTQWWGNATQEDRRRMLEDVALYRVESGQSANMEAARAFGVGEGRQEARRLNTDDITKLPKSVSDAIIRWAPFNWDRFTGAEQAETLPAAEGIQPPPGDQLEVMELPPERGEPKQPSEAPEHRGADRGVGKPELDAMVEAFNAYQQEMYRDGEQVTRVFEGPANEDVVRLKNKVDNYVSESGYMSKSQAETTIAGWKRNAIDQGIDPEKRRINGNKVVLSLFDLTGSWSRPWAEAGYDVYTFDIQDDEFMGDINNFSTQFFVDNFNSFEGKEVYAVLAACPCTDFASSGARHFAAKDEDGRTYASVQLVQQTLATIEFFKPQIWAIENPVGRIQRMTGLPDWRLSFDPYHLGEDYTKKTLLWGRFNADLPIAPTEPTAGSKMHQKYGGKSLATKNARSETPEGFSYAFFDANNQIDHPVMSAQNRFDMMNKSVIEDAVSDYGMTEDDIFSIIDDDYYIDLDYEQAAMRLREQFDEPQSEPPAEFSDKTEAPLLESYTEQDLQDREAVDMEAGERRDQIDRERELFDLDSGQGTIAGTNDPTQTDGNQGGLFRRDSELGINRGATPRPVITDEEFNTVIDRIVGDNPEARARIVAVDSFADLPEPLRIAARKQGSDGSDVDAVTHRGQIYIVRGRMRSKARMERTLLHEGTHVGINAMYADEGVRRAMNRMYVAMGGSKGFNKMAKDLGIQRQIAPYREGLAREGASEQVRNEILVNEMLAYVGERGSKTFQDRVREVIGSIRNWLRKNGLMTLANMRVSDIAYIAKRARENGLRSTEARGNGEPAFSIVAEQARARQTDLGLYSNAEQILLDQGDKIFKPSKKNPEGRVKGDQILSFLKARGLKKEEATYVDLEAELVDPGSVQSFTRDEVIQILRDNRPDLVADVRTGISNEDEALVGITDAEIIDGQENYEHIIEDMRTDVFEAGADDTDNFSLIDLVTALYDYDKDIMKNMASADFPNISMEAVDSTLVADIFKAYVSETDNSYLPQRLVDAYGENLVDDTILEIAEQRYLDSPYYRHGVFNSDDDYIGEIIGNDDVGYILNNANGERIRSNETIYTIDEARVSFQLYAEETGNIGSAYQDGNTQYFGYLGIAPSDINDYREVVVSLEDNRLADSTYHGGHFDVENMLFHVLSTDRTTEFGDTLAIEETQSDWHSAIRRAGGTYDPVKGDQLLAEAEELRAEERAANTKNSEMLMAFGKRIEGIPGTRKTTEFLGNVSNLGKFLTNVAPKLTDAGIWEMAAIVYNSKEGGDNRVMNVTLGRIDQGARFRGELTEKMVGEIMKVMVEAPVAQRYWTIDIKGQEPAGVEKLLRDNFDPIFDFRINSKELTGYDPLRDEELNSRWDTQDITPEVAELRQMAQEFAENNARYLGIMSRVNNMEKRGRALKSAPPESPFRDDKYLDLVAKIMLREAITERKTGIAFSKGDRVQNRWSENYDYEAIYNRKLKKAMDKLMGMPAQSMDESGRIETGDDVSSDGFWAYPITPEFAENVKETGLPMFRRDGSDGRIYPKKPAEERLRDKFLRVLQDKMLPVYRTQQAIEVENERELDVSENPYLTEELFYGKTEEDLRQLELRFVEPLIREMKEAGVTSDQLNDYLYAKHAPERNRQIREINPEFEGPGSGMSDAEAAEILGQYTGDKLQQMENLADRVYQMTQLTRDLLRASGLQADEVTDSWEATYENYVPLRGFADNEVDAKGGRIPTGRGFDIRGKEAKRAYGRKSRAQGPLAQVIADLTGKIIRNRKNEVGKAFLQMVENNPDPSQWQVFTDANPDPAALRGPKANKRTAQMEMARSDAYLGVKRDGVVHYIKVRDRKLLNAMQNVGPEQMDVATRVVGGVTRFLSSVNTAYDPTFVLTNFARDIQAALINVAGEQTKEGGLIEGERIGAKVAKGTPRAVGAIRNYVRNKKVGDGDSEYEAYFKEFLDAGAKTGYFDSPDLDVLEKRLAARINQGEGALAKGKTAAKWIGDFVSDYNLAVENGVRLSAYIEARKAGIDKSKAASLAKNLTVNFNRKGSAGATINSWYMFFNAAVQGLKQFTNTLSPISLDAEGNVQVQRRLNRAQKIAGGLVGIAYAAAVFNREIGGEDDDGESFYDKINPAIRERNLILMKPDGSGEYYKIPLPYGYNFFYTIGTAVEALQNGSSRRKENALGEVFNSFVTAFSPISVHANAGISALPTILVPGAELASNTNFFGSDIVRENFPSGPQRSAAHNYWNSTKEPYVAIAQFLNDTVGGGSEYRSGSLGFMFDISTDISPDVIEHITEFGLGGIYRASMGAVDAVERVTSDREIDPTRMPFASKVLGRNDSDYADQERFYDTRQLIINARKEREDARGQERIAADQANNFIHRLYQPMLATEKFLSQQRDRRDKVRDDDRLTEAERDAQLERIRERMDDRIDRFNKRYQEHLEKYGN
jgi:hypothetical protein